MSEQNIKFKLEGIVAIGKRGQFVLPKDIRKKASINPKEKLVLVYKNDETPSIKVAKNELLNLQSH